MNRTLFLMIFFLSVFSIKGQELVVNGVAKSEEGPLPFATIGILNKNVGTIGDEQGGFELTIPNPTIEDTLIVSYLGYKSKSFVPFLMNQLIELEFNLEKDIIQLRPVVVVNNGARKISLGGKKEKSAFVWVSAPGKGAEVATLMRPKSPVFLNKVGVQILNKTREPFKLLLNLYTYDPKTKLPGKSLLQHEVLIESDLEEGWLDVAIDGENIIVDAPFYVTFKWVEIEKQNPQLAINDKLTSLTRYVALGKWIELFNWNIRAEGVRIGTK